MWPVSLGTGPLVLAVQRNRRRWGTDTPEGVTPNHPLGNGYTEGSASAGPSVRWGQGSTTATVGNVLPPTRERYSRRLDGC